MFESITIDYSIGDDIYKFILSLINKNDFRKDVIQARISTGIIVKVFNFETKKLTFKTNLFDKRLVSEYFKNDRNYLMSFLSEDKKLTPYENWGIVKINGVPFCKHKFDMAAFRILKKYSSKYKYLLNAVSSIIYSGEVYSDDINYSRLPKFKPHRGKASTVKRDYLLYETNKYKSPSYIENNLSNFLGIDMDYKQIQDAITSYKKRVKNKIISLNSFRII